MKIKQINGKHQYINIESEQARAHFVDPYNYTDAILDQFEHDIYKDFITENDKIILDIGANVGMFALHVSPWAEKIVCVEPTPEHMKIQKEILINVPAVSYAIEKEEPFATENPEIINEQAALSDYTGKAKFYWCGINTTMNSLQDRGDRTFDVDTITLKDLCEKHGLTKVDFCKIDIEGSEWQAITKETLQPVFQIINKIWIELHPPEPKSQEVFKNIFESVGYKVDKIIHDTLFAYK